MIRNVVIEDAKEIVDIYNYYVVNTIITFDKTPFSTTDFEEKIKTTSSEFPFYVYEENNEILGYAYGSKWRKKPSYDNTVEITIYLKNGIQGKGIGTKLYSKLIETLKNQKYHTLIGGLTLPNEVSVKLHEKFGFEKAAHFKEVGRKFDKWHDVGFWQLTF
jgi:phosphinothricin acetyltransferase